MASIINQFHGLLMKPVNKLKENLPQEGVGPANYLWRAKILLNRATSLKEQSLRSPLEIDPAIKQPNTIISRANQATIRATRSIPKHIKLATPTVATVKNQIIIINVNARATGNGIESVIIQGMPEKVEVSSENTWAVAKIPGRNNPFYMYTGSEDTISFDISWYTTQRDRKDVITKCRILESWTKGNGYSASPPELWISWGSGQMFMDDTFILFSAPYELSNFQNSCRYQREGEIVDLGLWPNVATQKLTFKRVSANNRTTENIQSV